MDGIYTDRTACRHPGSSHNRAAVVSFSDGHVETHRWVDQRTIKANSANYHNHNEASAGNKDIVWLRERTTVPLNGTPGTVMRP